MKQETVTQAISATPAVGGATYSVITLNEAVAIMTMLYIGLQMVYLIWKWRKEGKTK